MFLHFHSTSRQARYTIMTAVIILVIELITFIIGRMKLLVLANKLVFCGLPTDYF